MKKFFRIEENYKFEWNDLRCFITVLNVILIMAFGLSISWFGLAVALIGIIKDLTVDRKVNGLLMPKMGVVWPLIIDQRLVHLTPHMFPCH